MTDKKKRVYKLFLESEDYIENLAEQYPVETIIKFLRENQITTEQFYGVGECCGCCEVCGENNFLIWRDDLYYDGDKFSLEEIGDEVDFSVYICTKCGKWTSYIEH